MEVSEELELEELDELSGTGVSSGQPELEELLLELEESGGAGLLAVTAME